MHFRWLKQVGAEKLIVVFGGWALGPGMLAHLVGPYDVLFAEDYRDLSTGLPDVPAYTDVSLVAFSFGVAAYGHWQVTHDFAFDRRIAVNGTLTPVDAKTGISPLRFKRTYDGLDTVSFQQFVARSYGDTLPMMPLDVDARKTELWAIQARGPAPGVDFDRIWISRADKIIPPNNQARGWQDHVTRTTYIDAPHVPFLVWSNWHEVLA